MGENRLRQSLQNRFLPQYGVLTSVRATRQPCNDLRKRRAISWDLPPSGHVIEPGVYGLPSVTLKKEHITTKGILIGNTVRWHRTTRYLTNLLIASLL